MKKEKIIYINHIEKAKNFSNRAMQLGTDVTLKSQDGRYIVDAKSIMGIFSLDLSNEVIVEYDENEVEFEKFLKGLVR